MVDHAGLPLLEWAKLQQTKALIAAIEQLTVVVGACATALATPLSEVEESPLPDDVHDLLFTLAGLVRDGDLDPYPHLRLDTAAMLFARGYDVTPVGSMGEEDDDER